MPVHGRSYENLRKSLVASIKASLVTKMRIMKFIITSSSQALQFIFTILLGKVFSFNRARAIVPCRSPHVENCSLNENVSQLILVEV